MAKKCGRLGRIREGYKTLNSEEEVCISRVVTILTINVGQWNVTYYRVSAIRVVICSLLVRSKVKSTAFQAVRFIYDFLTYDMALN